MDRGIAVFAVNPKQLDRRPRSSGDRAGAAGRAARRGDPALFAGSGKDRPRHTARGGASGRPGERLPRLANADRCGAGNQAQRQVAACRDAAGLLATAALRRLPLGTRRHPARPTQPRPLCRSQSPWLLSRPSAPRRCRQAARRRLRHAHTPNPVRSEPHQSASGRSRMSRPLSRSIPLFDLNGHPSVPTGIANGTARRSRPGCRTAGHRHSRREGPGWRRARSHAAGRPGTSRALAAGVTAPPNPLDHWWGVPPLLFPGPLPQLGRSADENSLSTESHPHMTKAGFDGVEGAIMRKCTVAYFPQCHGSV